MDTYQLKEDFKFEQLPTQEKIDYFTTIAHKTLKCWCIPQDSTLILLNYTENATFKVSHQNDNWIIRIHRLWYTDKESVLSEMDWLSALSEVIRVPRPIISISNEFIIEIDTKFGKRLVDCFRFEEGNTIAFNDKVDFEEMGRIIAKMHMVSERYERPRYYKRIDWDLNKTFSAINNFHNEWYIDNHYLNENEKDWISSAVSIISDRLNKYGKNRKNYGLIHSDCRFTNILNNDGKYILLDFDDFGEGWYVYDLTSVFGFNEDHPYMREASKRLIAGYQEIRELTDEDLDLFDTFLLFRRIGLIGTGMFFEKYAVCGDGETLHAVEEWHDFYHKTANAAKRYVNEN